MTKEIEEALAWADEMVFRAGEKDAEFIRTLAAAYRAKCGEAKALEAVALSAYEKLAWVSILEHAKEGMEEWANEPRNRKWWRRIDGTPIPNDLMIRVSQAVGRAFEPLHSAAERLVNPRGAALAAKGDANDN